MCYDSIGPNWCGPMGGEGLRHQLVSILAGEAFISSSFPCSTPSIEALGRN